MPNATAAVRVAALALAAAALVGCGRSSGPAQTETPQFYYRDANGNLIYRNGPEVDASGRPLTAGVAPSAPAAPAPVASPPAARAPAPPAPQPQPRPVVPAPPGAASFSVSEDGPRFDINGNLIRDTQGLLVPEFDAEGNIVSDPAGRRFAPPPAPQTSRPAQPAPQAAAPTPTRTAAGSAQTNQPAAGGDGYGPQASDAMAAEYGRIAPEFVPPPSIVRDPRATAAFDLAGTTWKVRSVGGRPVPSGMSLVFVQIGQQRMAIVDSVCGQERGAYQNGKGGQAAISGIVGCQEDRGVAGVLSTVRRYAVDAKGATLELIDSAGSSVALLELINASGRSGAA